LSGNKEIQKEKENEEVQKEYEKYGESPCTWLSLDAAAASTSLG
jgi:hypothetical protein